MEQESMAFVLEELQDCIEAMTIGENCEVFSCFNKGNIDVKIQANAAHIICIDGVIGRILIFLVGWKVIIAIPLL